MNPARLALPFLLLSLPLPALPHEVEAEVFRGRAVAVRASVHGGKHLVAARAEVYSPADPASPWWTGSTDRAGWVAFVPDTPGRWRVRIVDASGHGLDTRVDVPPPGGSGAAVPEGAVPDAVPDAPGARKGLHALAAPVAGLAIIAAFFGFLFLRESRKRP